MADEAYRARIIEDRDPFLPTVRLYIMRRLGYGRSEYLMADGTWKEVEQGSPVEGDAGLPLPAEAIEAVAIAAQEFQGHASHADTEARILREWLAVERGRVDRALLGDR